MRFIFVRFILLVLFACKVSVFDLHSQTSEYFTGRIINEINAEPVDFATVYLKSNRTGVYTNAEGDFIIPVDRKFEADSLIITSIGFRRKAIAVKDLTREHLNRIFLEPATYSFKEIKVIASKNKLTAETIVKRAIRRIIKNYPVKPFSYISYYRDYQKKDNLYINLNEAIIRTWDNGFNKKSSLNDYSLLDFRKNLDFLRSNISPYYDNKIKYIPDATLPDHGGNELLILMVHDALRNFRIPAFSFIYRFANDFIPNHNFLEIVPVFNNNLLLYKIGFMAKGYITGDSVMARGEIFIQPDNYAIHKLDYSCYYLTMKDKGKEMFNIRTEYGYENSSDSLLRLKYVSFNNLFRAADTSDLHYFRLIDTYSDDPFTFLTLIFEFNNKIDKSSAYDPENLKIMYGDSIAVINRISLGDKKIMITLKYAGYINNKPRILLNNIKDIYGNVIFEKRYEEYYQYRELFVENYDRYIIPKDTCFVNSKPLENNCKSPSGGDNKYWMNTPLIVKSLKEKN